MGRQKRRTEIAEQFAWRPISMLESPAYRALSLSGRRVLDRIEIEHAHHGGKDNGRLPVTFDDFAKYGVDRHCIASAIRENEVLGFAEITERGRAGNAEFRSPHRFRLTHRRSWDGTDATDEWRRIETLDQARALARGARDAATTRSARKAKKVAAKKLAPEMESPHSGSTEAESKTLH
jgi:hypothetical protein